MQPRENHQEAGAAPGGVRAAPPGAARHRAALPALLNAAPNAKALARCLWRRLGLAVGLGVLLAGLAGASAWVFAPLPKHQVRTLIQVPPGSHYVVKTGEAVPEMASHQRTQAALARSRMVFNSALKDPAVAGLPLIAGRIDAMEWLEKEVQVDFSVAPGIMRIAISGAQTGELEKLVNALRGAYIREVVEKGRSVRDERVGYLAELIEKYDSRLKATREEQKLLEEQLGSKNPDVRGRMLAFLQQQLNFNEAELLRAQSDLRKARLALGEEKAREAKGEPPAAVSERDVAAALAKDPEVAALKVEIRHIEKRIAKNVDRAAQGDQAPAVLSDKREVTRLKKELRAVTGRLRPEVVKQLRESGGPDPRAGAVAVAVAEEARVVNLEMMEKTLDKEVQHLRGHVAELGKKGVKLDNYREDLGHVEAMTRRFKEEYEALKVEMAAPLAGPRP